MLYCGLVRYDLIVRSDRYHYQSDTTAQNRFLVKMVNKSAELEPPATTVPAECQKTLPEQLFSVDTVQRMSQLKPFLDCKITTFDSEFLCSRSMLASVSRVLRCTYACASACKRLHACMLKFTRARRQFGIPSTRCRCLLVSTPRRHRPSNNSHMYQLRLRRRECMQTLKGLGPRRRTDIASTLILLTLIF